MMKRFALILLLSSMSFAQYQVVKHKNTGPPTDGGGGAAGAGTSVDCVMTFPVVAGELLVVSGTAAGNNIPTMTVADTDSDSFSLTGGTPFTYYNNSPGLGGMNVWLATVGTTNASETVTVTRNSTTNNDMACSAQTYNNVSAVSDAGAGTLKYGITKTGLVAFSLFSGATGATDTTTYAYDEIVAVFGINMASKLPATVTAQNGFTQKQVGTQTRTGGIGGYMVSTIQSQSTSVLGVWSGSVAVDAGDKVLGSGGVILALKGTGTHATTPPAITLIASTSCVGANLCTTPAINTTGATLLVIGLTGYDGGYSVSSSPANTWNALTLYSSGAHARTQLFYAYAPTTGASQTATCTTNFAAYGGCFFLAFSGTLATSSVLDVDTGSTVIWGQPDRVWYGGPVTTTQPGELVITTYCAWSGGITSLTIDPGSTIVAFYDNNGGVNFPTAIAYTTSPAQGVYKPAWVAAGDINSNASAVASFKY